MAKIVAVKFLKVTWNEGTDIQQVRAPRNESSEAWAARSLSKGLDDALLEMENLLCDYLKEGWQPKGEVSYVTNNLQVSGFSGPGTDKRTHLVQTLVKYETPVATTTLDLFSSSLNQISQPNNTNEDLIKIAT
jgi:hypothetical protein